MPGFKIKEQEGYNLSTAENETIEAIAVLGDPGADRILFWDESANTWKFLTVGTGLDITATTLTATGMSNPMTAIGDMIYGDTAGAIARLAGNTTTTKKFLTSVGDGTNSTAPSYSLDFSTDGTFAGNSDTIIPSQKAIKTYVDGSVAGLLDYRGGYDASGNTYPVAGGSGTAGAVLKGDMWIISVAGTLGGEAVQVGDSIIANVDTPAQTASNWDHLNANISYVPEDVANKKTSLADNSDIYYPSQKAVKTAVDAKAPLASPTFTGTVTLPKTTKIQDTSADHTYNLAVSELTADRTVTLPLLTGDDTFLFKDFHKATSAEINTGTEDDKYVTPKALEDSSYMKNPMTTAGDVIYGGTDGAPTRLAKGTAGQVLTMNSGATAPEWADASGGSDDQLLTAVVNISSADLKALNTSPKTLLPSPGTDKIIILEGIVVYSTGGSINYSGGSTAKVYYDDETTLASSNTIPGSFLAAAASTTKIVHSPRPANSQSFDGMQNRAIVLKTTADFADGDGTSKLYIRYMICSA